MKPAAQALNTCDSRIHLQIGFELGRPRIIASEYENASLVGIHALEEAYIRHVYEECAHNKYETARRLQISRATLYRKLKEYDLCA